MSFRGSAWVSCGTRRQTSGRVQRKRAAFGAVRQQKRHKKAASKIRLEGEGQKFGYSVQGITMGEPVYKSVSR